MKNTKTLQIIFESLLCATVFIVLLGVTTNLLYSKSIKALEDQIKRGLTSTISATATTLNGELHSGFNKNTLASDPDYQLAAHHMERIRQAAADIRYIYTCILKQGKVYFMVNPSPQNDADGDGQPDTPPALMTPYNDAPPELITALQKEAIAISSTPYKDQWGHFISAYAPFYDHHGRFIGVLAMDLELSNFYKRLTSIERVFSKAKIIILFLGLIVGLTIWWIRRSHVNSLNSNLSKETDSAERLAQANGLNQTLSELNNYFYLQSSQKERANTQQISRLTALNQFAQSLKPLELKPTKQSIDTWFTTLNKSLKEQDSGSHKWQIPLDLEVFFPCRTFAKEFAHFHRLLSAREQKPMTAETSLTKELLDGWLLTTRFLLPPDQVEIIKELSSTQQYVVKVDNKNLSSKLIKEYQVPEIYLVTAINRLRLMGCQFVVHDNGEIDILWNIIKEKKE